MGRMAVYFTDRAGLDLSTNQRCRAVVALPACRGKDRPAHHGGNGPLTGIGNRRYFLERAQQAILQAESLQTPLSIILIDVDHFKQLNDTYGHAVGDDVLVMVANVCRHGLRTGDIFSRWGGEEFIVLLPLTTLEDGRLLAERLRTSVASTSFEGILRFKQSAWGV